MKKRYVRPILVTVIMAGLVGAYVIDDVMRPAAAPDKLEYLPSRFSTGEVARTATGISWVSTAMAATGSSGPTVFDFATETVGADPATFLGVVGFWTIGADGDNKVLVVDGRRWKRGKTAAGIADKARALYGERYAEFLDNVTAFAYFPYAVAKGIDDFREGEISLRFKAIDGRIDQAAGILFDLKPNGDYFTVRANALEDNLVLWQFKQGKRSSVKWIKNTPTPGKQWQDLKVVIKGRDVEGWLNGTRYMQHTLSAPVSGKVGVWSKADSLVYIDDYSVRSATR
jgi:hypothetical protein